MRTLLASTLVSLSVALAAAATLKFDAPAGWVSKTPSSSMRVAEFTLPKVAGDAEDAALVIYFFGAAGGGGVQANLDRWMDQMAQPGGGESKAVAKTSNLTSHGLKVSLVDVSGTYTAEMTPGAGDRVNKPGFRLRAAVVETPGGAHYVKLTGPAKTVAKWDEAFTAFIKSLRWE